MASREPIRLESLDPQQLNQLKQRLGDEVNGYMRSGNQLMLAATKFDESRQSVAALAEKKDGHSLLIPVTQSLYVNGTVASTDKVLIDIGTGYYAEMTAKEGQDYCQRKVTKLQESLIGVQQIIRERQAMLNQVTSVLQEKMRATQQAQQGATSAAQ